MNRSEKRGVCERSKGEDKCVQRGKFAEGYEGKRREQKRGKRQYFLSVRYDKRRKNATPCGKKKAKRRAEGKYGKDSRFAKYQKILEKQNGI